MNLCLDSTNLIWLRDLLKADRKTAVEITLRAFQSMHVANQVDRTLGIYFRSSAWHTPVEEQRRSLLPVSYYLMVRRGANAEQPIGMSGLYCTAWASEGVFWLGWFSVDPAWQGQGYGRLLLQASIDLAKQKGAHLLCLETSQTLDAACHLYAHMGFEKFGQVPDYWAPGGDLVILARRLN